MIEIIHTQQTLLEQHEHHESQEGTQKRKEWNGRQVIYARKNERERERGRGREGERYRTGEEESAAERKGVGGEGGGKEYKIY